MIAGFLSNGLLPVHSRTHNLFPFFRSTCKGCSPYISLPILSWSSPKSTFNYTLLTSDSLTCSSWRALQATHSFSYSNYNPKSKIVGRIPPSRSTSGQISFNIQQSCNTFLSQKQHFCAFLSSQQLCHFSSLSFHLQKREKWEPTDITISLNIHG